MMEKVVQSQPTSTDADRRTTTLPFCACRYPAGNIQPTADFRDCCRSIFEQAQLPVSEGGVGAPPHGASWNHDALGT